MDNCSITLSSSPPFNTTAHICDANGEEMSVAELRLTLRAEDENLIADMLCYELVSSSVNTKFGPLLTFAVDEKGDPVLVSKRMLVTSLKITETEPSAEEVR